MIDDEADEQERAEAEALARALESDGAVRPIGGAKPQQGALETAALLRAVAAPGELSEERAKALFAALQPEIERRIPVKRSRVTIWVAGAAAIGLAAAAAVFLYVPAGDEPPTHEASSSYMKLSSSPSQAPFEANAPLPSPRAKLLAAQAALSAQDVAPEDRAAFEREMRAYRVTVLRKLKESYAVQVGMLEPGRAR